MVRQYFDKKFIAVFAIILVATILLCTLSFGVVAYGYSTVKSNIASSLDANTKAEGQSDFASCNASDSSKNIYFAEISYNNLLLNDGSLVRKLQIWVNRDELLNGMSESDAELMDGYVNLAMDSIIGFLTLNGNDVVELDGYLEVILEEYDSLTDLYIAAGHDGYEVDDGDDTRQETGVFFNTYYSTGSTPFASYEDSVIPYIVNFLVLIPGIDEEDIALVYNYGTKYSPSLISSDADNIYLFKKEGIYIHKFTMTTSSVNRTYTFIQRSPNTLVWYGIALAVTAAVGATFCVVAYKHKKKA